MNRDVINGKWKQMKGEFLMLWAEWFDSDDIWIHGSHESLSGIVQEDYGKHDNGAERSSV